MLKKLENILVFIIFKLFYYIIKLLPDRLNFYFGRGFGYFAYIITRKRRKIGENNLKKALGNKLTQAEIKQKIKEVYQHLGLVLVEFILLEKINENNLENILEIKGQKNLKKAFAGDKGVIIYSAHLGNWEWLAAFISLMGYSVNAIAYQQKNTHFNEMINSIRESKGINIIPKGIAVREAYQKLKKGRGLFILGDQDAREKGWNIDFFGQNSSTYAGVVKLAQRTGAVILPAFLIRKKWNKHKLIFYPPRSVEKNISTADQKSLLQDLTALVESQISQNLSQWLWLHRRWKEIKD